MRSRVELLGGDLHEQFALWSMADDVGGKLLNFVEVHYGMKFLFAYDQFVVYGRCKLHLGYYGAQNKVTIFLKFIELAYRDQIIIKKIAIVA